MQWADGAGSSCTPAVAFDIVTCCTAHEQAPEDGTDVVTAAKRVLTEPGLNALGLKDRRDITRLVAQSALQVCHWPNCPNCMYLLAQDALQIALLTLQPR